jgi:predicted RNase H-like nuclease
MSPRTFSIVGFDSAWTDKPKAPGAIGIIRSNSEGRLSLVEPQLASFAQALQIIKDEAQDTDLCLVAIDQPTIVPNQSSLRPVDRIAGSLISWIGGGVQPANRSKIGMFDDNAPIWRFKDALGAVEDPEATRNASTGLYLMEVFPALALAGLNRTFCDRLKGPRYNPERRKTFQLAHWHNVVETIKGFGTLAAVEQIETWCNITRSLPFPKKADQDKLDALICSLVGLHWLVGQREQSMMIGDLETGYMIAPAIDGVHNRIAAKAKEMGVAVNGRIAIGPPVSNFPAQV